MMSEPQQELTHTLSHHTIIREVSPAFTNTYIQTQDLRKLSLFLLIIKTVLKEKDNVTYTMKPVHTQIHT